MVLVCALAGVLVFVGLLFYSDVRAAGRALAQFKWGYLVLILPAAILNYAIRFCKWEYYLRNLDIRPPFTHSLGIFMSGLTMSVTPGKLGEVFKPYLLQRLEGTEISRSVPVVFAEIATDALGLLVLATVSVSSFPNVPKAVMIVPAIVLVAAIGVIRWRRVCDYLISGCDRMPLVNRISASLRIGYEGAYTLFEVKSLVAGVILSVISWGFECLATYFVLQGFNISATLALSTFIFSFSTLAGAVSMIPGGLIVTEGSLAGLLVLAGSPMAVAGSATVITRLCTLWFAVLLGLISLALVKGRMSSATGLFNKEVA